MSIAAHPDQDQLTHRIQRVRESDYHTFHAMVYRFVNPLFSNKNGVLNGKGGLNASGRWNLKGCCPVTYASLSPETALAESLAHARYFSLPLHKSMPRILVALEVQVRKSLDLRDGALRRQLRLSRQTIRNTNWIRENQNGYTAITQAWGAAICRVGVEALIVPSAADPSGVNVMVFPENLHRSSRMNLLSPVKWQ